MIEAIKLWRRRLGAERRLERFRNGYSWAAGELLSERTTLSSLTDRVCQQAPYENSRDPFDRGALQAIYDWKVKHQCPRHAGHKGEEE